MYGHLQAYRFTCAPNCLQPMYPLCTRKQCPHLPVTACEESRQYSEGMYVADLFYCTLAPTVCNPLCLQANNAYIFPPIGHAAVLTRCPSIPDEVFLLAAECLGGMSTREELQQGL